MTTFRLAIIATFGVLVALFIAITVLGILAKRSPSDSPSPSVLETTVKSCKPDGFGYVTAEGEVANRGTRTARNILVIAQLKRADGTIVDSGEDDLRLALDPGQSAVFRVLLRDDSGHTGAKCVAGSGSD